MNRNSKTKNIVICALMAAIMCILCPISLPIGPVPISLQIFVCLLMVYIVGTYRALTAFFVYLLLGAAGLPVFSGYQGGLAKLSGPTGGYIIGFAFTILLAGLVMDHIGRRWMAAALGMILGIAAAYFFGTLWFMFQAKCELNYALSVCVLPFIPLDVLKMAAAILLGAPVRTVLERNRLI